MTLEEIHQKRDKLAAKESRLECKLKKVRLEKELLHELCGHPSLKKSQWTDYSGGTSCQESCPDCGYERNW